MVIKYIYVLKRYRNDYEIGSEADVFSINEKHEVSVNATWCKGVVSLVGKGGAIRVQRGNVNIRNWFVSLYLSMKYIKHIKMYFYDITSKDVWR